MNMNIKSAVMLIFSVCACLCLRAADSSGDLAETVKRFEALGMPNVVNAEYVCLEYPRSIYIKSMLPYPEDETAGNAWLLEETCDAAGRRVGRFVVNGGKIVNIQFMNRIERRRLERGEFDLPSAQWQKARLIRDINAARRFLSDSPGTRKENDRKQYAGGLFLFALQLFQRGDTRAASEMVDGLCRTQDERDDAEKGALNDLMDGQYATIVWNFIKDRDWCRYRDGIRDLLVRHPDGWTNAKQLHDLLPLVEQRVDQGVLPVTAPELSEADRRLATELSSLRTQPAPFLRATHWWNILWLVPEAWPAGITAIGPVDLAIRARGINALPILLSMTNDTTLTECILWNPHGESDMPNVGFLPRPASRGEVALRILVHILPERLLAEQQNLGYPNNVIRSAQMLYTSHKNATHEALAVLYLPSWQGALNSAAQTFLLNAARQKPVPEYATYLAETASLFTRYYDANHTLLAEALVAYAAVRGTEAQSFVGAFCDRLESQAQEYRKPNGAFFGDAEATAERVRTTKEQLSQTAQTLRALRLDATDDALQSEDGTKAEQHYKQIMLTARRGGNPHEKSAHPRLPAIPTFLSADERADCLRHLKEASSREQAATIFWSLTDRERAALPELLQADTGLNAALTVYAGTITKISIPEDAAFAGRLNAWEGKRITVELVDAVKTYCETQIKAGRAMLGILERGADLDGWTVTVRPLSKTEKPGRIDGYYGSVCETDLYADASWRTSTAKPESFWDALLTADLKQMQTFRFAVEQVCAGTHRAWLPGIIAFTAGGDGK